MITRMPPSAAAEHLAAALRFKTVTVSPEAPLPKGELAALRAYLAKTYPLTHKSLEVEQVGENLLVTWKPAKPSDKKPVILMAHMDVVPIEPGTEAKWTHPPFDGVIADGFVWGRGALDDKSPLIAILEAIEGMLARGVTPNRPVVLAFGADEEVSGSGAETIAKVLEKRGVKADFVVDEGGAVTVGVTQGVKAPVGNIAVAEKGYISLELTASGPPGHSSLPAANTSVAVLAKVIDRLNTHQMPAHITPPVRQMLNALAPHLPLAERLAIRAGKVGEWLLLRSLGKTATGNAQIRTSFAPTIFKAGVKDNVVPETAKAVVNFRILPGETMADVVAHVKAAIGDAAVKVEVLSGAHDPPRVSSATEAGFVAMAEAVRATFGNDVVMAPTLASGTTDSRHYAKVADNLYRFTPVKLTAQDIATIHGTNEKIGVKAFDDMVSFYERLLTRIAV